MVEENQSYNVAFVGTRAAGGYEGIVTWTSFASKEAFDQWWVENEEVRKRERVFEEGISQERAVELVDQTPIACRIAAAYHEARNCSPNGEIDQNILEMQLANVAFIISHTGESESKKKPECQMHGSIEHMQSITGKCSACGES